MNTIDKIIDKTLEIIGSIVEMSAVFIVNFILFILFLFPLTLIAYPFNRNHKYKTPLYALKMFYICTFKYKQIP